MCTQIKCCTVLFLTINSCAKSRPARFTLGAVSPCTGGSAVPLVLVGTGAVLLQRQCLLTCLFQTPLLSPRADAEGHPVARGVDEDQGCSMHRWLPYIFF